MSTPKNILLTGASRGIGLAIAKFLLKDGHRLFLVARTAAPMEALKKEFPGQAEFLAADLGDFEVGPKAVSLALSAFTTLDALILNHGTLSPVKRIADSSPEEWRKTYDVNFFSLLAFIQPAIPTLRSSKGRIILTSSGAASSTYSTWGAYGSSKAAMNHLAGTLATEEPNITSIAIRPGVVDTDMQTQVRESHGVMDGKDAEKFKSLFVDGKLLKPEQPGNVMARLALGAEEGLSGKFLTWNDKELARYQD
ncbi:uncharacterized protein L3040_008205 [Drepanopeziza brunnea f. sp. 'multigermtubi']|uniref:Short-chain dehydrogenase n=1 Tax=Marssonina brunnea f. sp. multigermtubi (strain MB_m1) TaxID=1072389 RepID=K1WUZ8_MARBU|nr:short-chain dehydrogenase [Drepanopeziza brunnea f. sp. 'multigermtubi' MB_m1]EKD12468.1 short-chain dehydrogenase [Drepanopeziza brunnea f. sp. 'multigermtubi' MB_m1]KAJ5034937.1 hypothetical protein L3040_008205 [Drepanopeziza brunnea f. sp. 'multigermtubi']